MKGGQPLHLGCLGLANWTIGRGAHETKEGGAGMVPFALTQPFSRLASLGLLGLMKVLGSDRTCDRFRREPSGMLWNRLPRLTPRPKQWPKQ